MNIDSNRSLAIELAKPQALMIPEKKDSLRSFNRELIHDATASLIAELPKSDVPDEFQFSCGILLKDRASSYIPAKMKMEVSSSAKFFVEDKEESEGEQAVSFRISIESQDIALAQLFFEQDEESVYVTCWVAVGGDEQTKAKWGQMGIGTSLVQSLDTMLSTIVEKYSSFFAGKNLYFVFQDINNDQWPDENHPLKDGWADKELQSLGYIFDSKVIEQKIPYKICDNPYETRIKIFQTAEAELHPPPEV